MMMVDALTNAPRRRKTGRRIGFLKRNRNISENAKNASRTPT
jgi:hypothetical protein